MSGRPGASCDAEIRQQVEGDVRLERRVPDGRDVDIGDAAAVHLAPGGKALVSGEILRGDTSTAKQRQILHIP
jgi:hypothetical protein